MLYSWTTKETAARLRKAGELFDDNQLPEGPTAYVRWLEHIASRNDASGKLARALLGHPELRRRRYAWHRPFATRLGLGARDYGDQLIRVELDPRAIIGRFNPESREIWSFRDLDGRPVPLARALAEPGRIGAILHIREGQGDEPRYREFVLCNEAMIAAWSLSTPAIASVITGEIDKLSALANASPLTEDLNCIFSEVLAFHVPRYRPNRENLEAAARALSASIQEGPPLTVRPTRRFDATARGSPRDARGPEPHLLIDFIKRRHVGLGNDEHLPPAPHIAGQDHEHIGLVRDNPAITGSVVAERAHEAGALADLRPDAAERLFT